MKDLKTICEFLVHSEYTATENEKSDYFVECEYCKKRKSLKAWTTALVKSMIESDEMYTDYKDSVNELVADLLKDKECKNLLKEEYDYLKEY